MILTSKRHKMQSDELLLVLITGYLHSVYRMLMLTTLYNALMIQYLVISDIDAIKYLREQPCTNV